MQAIDMEQLEALKICEKITKKLLLSLFARGNNNAYDIVIGKNNGIVTVQDLSQQLLLFLAEHSEGWYLRRSGGRYTTDDKQVQIVFLNDEIQKAFYRVVSTTLYREKTRHENRKLYITTEDGQEIAADDIPALASNTNIDDVISNNNFKDFIKYLKANKKPLIAKRNIKEMYLRFKGFKYQEIAAKLQIKESQVKKDFQELKSLWKSFNKPERVQPQPLPVETWLTEEERATMKDWFDWLQARPDARRVEWVY